MATTKVPVSKITPKYQTGKTASVTITTNGWTDVASIVLPTTPVPHVYLIITSIEFANGAGLSSNEFATRYMDGASSQFAIVYHDCHSGTYFTSSTLNAPIVSSGETVKIQGYSQQASRGTTSRGNWVCVDLGVA